MDITKEELLEKIKKSGVKADTLNQLIGGYKGKLTEWKRGKTTLTQQEINIINDYLESKPVITEKALTEEELRLVTLYRRQTEQGKQGILDYAVFLENNQKKPL